LKLTDVTLRLRQHELAFGADRGRLAIDPGIGFGKTARNLESLHRPNELYQIDCPIRLGTS